MSLSCSFKNIVSNEKDANLRFFNDINCLLLLNYLLSYCDACSMSISAPFLVCFAF